MKVERRNTMIPVIQLATDNSKSIKKLKMETYQESSYIFSSNHDLCTDVYFD